MLLSQDGCIYGRIVPLLPGETVFGHTKASRYGSTKEDIEETLQEASSSNTSCLRALFMATALR